MLLEQLQFLLTPAGHALLAQTAETPVTPDTHLKLADTLGRQIGALKAQAVLETVLLRQRAVAKFSLAEEMFFTREALEQSSAEIVSTYRARRYADAGIERIADLGCGIGGDATSLAAVADVTGVDWDPVRLAMAQENVRAYGFSRQFHPLQADLLDLTPLPVDGIFADPSRRDEFGRRILSVHQYRPPLGNLENWRSTVPHQGVKISPGVDYEEIPAGAEIEFISVKGEVREGVLWFGDLKSIARRRATLLPGEHTLTDDPVEEVAVIEPAAFLYEPDRAVIRAHLVEQLAVRLEASKIDQDIAYLTAGYAVDTPFARCFALEAWFPFQLKRLRQYLREHNIGRVTIKKRGSPLDTEMLQRQLRLKGEEHRILFLTHVINKPAVLIGQEVTL